MSTLGLIFNLELDPTQYNARLLSAEQRANQAGQTISKSLNFAPKLSLTPKVDHAPLRQLNEHLNLKEKHFKQVQSYFDRNPLTAKTNLAGLDMLEQRLAKIKSGTYNVEVKGSQQNNSGDASKALIDRLENLTKQLQKPIRTQQSAGAGNILGNVVSGFGQQIGFRLGQGVEQSFKDRFKFNFADAGRSAGKYGINRSEGLGNLAAEKLGYSTGLKGVVSEFKKVGNAVDEFLDPDKLASKLNAFEDRLVDILEDIFVNNDFASAKGKVKESFGNAIAEIKEPTLKAAGVAVRVGAQPFRIRKRVELARSAQQAETMSSGIAVDRNEEIQKAKSISLITGGINYEKGGTNTDFAYNAVKRVLPESYSVPVTNPWSNDKASLGMLFEMRKLVAGLLGKNKEEVDPMPVDQLLNIAVEKGFNPDAIKMAATAMAYRKAYPDKPINMLGTSGGTYVVEEAVSILEKAGLKNIKGAGITAPVAGLTQTASKDNFAANVGDIDPLFLAMFGGKYSSPEDPMYQRSMREMPMQLPGLLSPGGSNKVVKGAGLSHALLPFLAEGGFQKNLKGFLGENIGELNPDFEGQKGIANLDFLRIKNDERSTLPRTLKAAFGDTATLKQLKANNNEGADGYSFFAPDRPDWRRDNDLKGMRRGVDKKGKRTTGVVKAEFEQYNDFLEELQQGLTKFYASNGTARSALVGALGKGAAIYGELEPMMLQVSEQLKQYSDLLKVDTSKMSSKSAYKLQSRIERLRKQYGDNPDQTRADLANSYIESKTAYTAKFNAAVESGKPKPENVSIAKIETDVVEKKAETVQEKIVEAAGKAVEKTGEIAEKTLVERINKILARPTFDADGAIEVNKPKREIKKLTDLRPKDIVDLAQSGAEDIGDLMGDIKKVAAPVTGLAGGIVGELLTRRINMVLARAAKQQGLIARKINNLSELTGDDMKMLSGLGTSDTKQALSLVGRVLEPVAVGGTRLVGAIGGKVLQTAKGQLQGGGDNAQLQGGNELKQLKAAEEEIRQLSAGKDTRALPSARDNRALPAAKRIDIADVERRIISLRKAVSAAESMSPTMRDQTKSSSAYFADVIESVTKDLDSAIQNLHPDERLRGTGSTLANLKSQVKVLSEKLNGVVKSLDKPLKSAAPVTQSQLAGNISSIGTSFVDTQKAMLNAPTEEIAEKSAQAIISEVEEARKAIADILESLGDEATPEVKKAAKSARLRITNAQKNAQVKYPEMSSTGENVVKGFENKISGSVDTAKKSGEKYAKAFKAEVESEFEIKSPSRWAQRTMGYVVQGFNKGIQGANTIRLDFIEQFKAQSEEGFGGRLEGLKQNILGFAKAGLGLLALNTLVPMFANIATITTDAAIEFERFERVINFTSGGGSKGADNLKFIRGEVARLNSDLKTSMSGFATLSASSVGTRMEGTGSQAIFSAVAQAGSVYQLDPQSQERAFLALGQMMSKGCYDSTTLVFTNNGWKFWDAVDGWDKFKTLNLKTNKIEYQRFTHIIKYHYSGYMLHVDNAEVNLEVTPDHRLLVAQEHAPEKLEIITADSLLNKAYWFFVDDALTPVLVQPEEFRWVYHDDFVHCVEVPNTTLYVKRNDKSVWSGNSVQAEELRGQLSEALPGAYQIFARSAGLSTRELSKMLELGQVTSEEFLPKFAQQLSAETTNGVAGASKSAQGSINKLNTAITDLQVGVGKGLLPARQMGMEAAAGVISLFAANAENLTNTVSTLGTMFLWMTGKGLLGFITSSVAARSLIIGLIKNIGSWVTAMGGLNGALLATASSAAKFAAKFVIISAVIDIIQAIGKTFSDAGGQIREFANSAAKSMESYKTALASARGENNKFASSVPKTAGDVKGESKLENMFFGMIPKGAARSIEKSVVGGFENTLTGFAIEKLFNVEIGTNSEKIIQDTNTAASDLVQQMNATLSEAYSQIGVGDKGALELGEMLKIDDQLKNIRSQKLNLAPGDNENRRKLEAEENALLEKREKLAKPIGQLQAKLTQELEASKSALQEYNEKLARGEIDQESYNRLTGDLKSAIESNQKAQDEFNKRLRGGIDIIQRMDRAYKNIQATLTDGNSQIRLDTAKQLQAVASAQEMPEGLSVGEADNARFLVNQQMLASQIENNKRALRELNAEMQNGEITRVMGAAGIASNAGAEQIRARMSEIDPSGDSTDSKILDRAATMREQMVSLETETAQLSEQVSQERTATQQKMRDLSRSIGDFYRNLQRESDELALAAKESSSRNAVSKAQTNLRRALVGFQGSFLDSFVDSLINLIDLLNKPLEEAINAQRQSAAAITQYQEALRTSQDLQRQLPGQQQGSMPQSAGNRVPFEGIRVTSARDASGEPGLDYVVSNGRRGANVGAVANGRVISTVTNQNWENNMGRGGPNTGRRGYGNRVVVRTVDEQTGEFIDMLYAHFDSVAVQVGQEVTVGTVLGTQGRTGSTTGAHASVDFFKPGTFQGTRASLAMRDRVGNQLQRNGRASDTNGRVPGGGNARTDDLSRRVEARRGVTNFTGATNARNSQGQRINGVDPARIQQAVNFYLQQGLPQASAAYLVGNLVQESGLDPSAVGDGGKARGIAQWQGGRQRGMPNDLQGQLGFALEEMQRDSPRSLQTLRDPNSSSQAIRGALRNWERYGVEGNRFEYGEQILGNMNGGRMPSSTSMSASTGATVPNALQVDQGATLAQGNLNSTLAQIQQTRDANIQAAQVAAELEKARADEELRQSQLNIARQDRQARRANEDRETNLEAPTPDRERRINLRNAQRSFEDDSEGLQEQLRQLQNTVSVGERVLAQARVTPGLQGFVGALEANITAAQESIARIKPIVDGRTAQLQREQAQINEAFAREQEALRLQRETQITDLRGQSRANLARNQGRSGDPYGAAQTNLQTSLDAENSRFANELAPVTEGLRLEPTNAQLLEMKRLIEEINGQNLANIRQEFQLTNQAISRDNSTAVFDSRMQLGNAIAENYSGAGLDRQARQVQGQLAVEQQRFDYSNQLAQLQEMQNSGKYTTQVMGELRSNLEALNATKLDNIEQQFSDSNQVIQTFQSGFQTAFQGLISGSMSAGEALQSFLDSILSGLANLAAQFITNELFGSLLGMGGSGGLGGLFGGASGGKGFGGIAGGLFSSFAGGGGDSGLGGVLSTVLGSLVGGFAEGGEIPDQDHSDYRKGNSPIARALKKEGARAVLIAATPGERVLTARQNENLMRSGMDQQILGYKTGGIIPGGAMPAINPVGGSTPSIPINLNFTDREQKDVNVPLLKDQLEVLLTKKIFDMSRPGGPLYRR